MEMEVFDVNQGYQKLVDILYMERVLTSEKLFYDNGANLTGVATIDDGENLVTYLILTNDPKHDWTTHDVDKVYVWSIFM